MSANMYDAWDCGDRPAIREQLKQREDIIRLAREAEASFETAESMFKFAALYRDHLLSTEIHSCHADCQRFACVQTRRAVEEEREACAKVCENIGDYDENVDEYYSDIYAAAIRERGQE
jgi:hypothetical protein